MAHFAEIDTNNKVLRVIVIADKDTADENGIEKEEIGIAFCKSLFGENTKWLQTSYNNKFRGKYAGTQDYYDETNNIFWTPAMVVISNDIIDVEEVTPTPAIENGTIS
jgi:hypothetical protein